MPANPPDFDDLYFRSALGRFVTGVTVVTAETQDCGKPIGLTISSFNSVSLKPPLILWTLTRKASSLAHLKLVDRYVIQVLSAHQVHLARRFAYGTQAERFAGVKLTRAPNGTLMLDEPNCAAWFECYNVTRHKAGDHLIFIGQVEHCHRGFGQPLIYHAGDFDLTPSTELIAGP
jgi:flavin reductase (DIM6/NTAB) family NADH-FMN oxidoreductase RutF